MTEAGPSTRGRRQQRPSSTNWNRISVWEVVGYTSTILLIAAVALGWFDVMIPWKAP